MAGGVIIAVGLSVIIGTVSRAITAHRDGERRMIAAWLADEKLNLVLLEGPEIFPKLHDTSGRFGPPYEEFAFEVAFNNPDDFEPYEVTVFIDWGNGDLQDDADQIAVDTVIARRQGDELEPREPLEPIDRQARYFPEEFGEAALEGGTDEGTTTSESTTAR